METSTRPNRKMWGIRTAFPMSRGIHHQKKLIIINTYIFYKKKKREKWKSKQKPFWKRKSYPSWSNHHPLPPAARQHTTSIVIKNQEIQSKNEKATLSAAPRIYLCISTGIIWLSSREQEEIGIGVKPRDPVLFLREYFTEVFDVSLRCGGEENGAMLRIYLSPLSVHYSCPHRRKRKEGGGRRTWGLSLLDLRRPATTRGNHHSLFGERLASTHNFSIPLLSLSLFPSKFLL